MHQAHFLLLLALLWGAAKLAAELAERLGQPPVLGELLAGILLGASVLGWVKPDELSAEIALLRYRPLDRPNA